MTTPETVGQLREILRGLPDNMPIEVYSASVDCPVFWVCGVEASDFNDLTVFRFCTEN